MSIWQHLFLGDLEYAPARDILAGLTPQQAGLHPNSEMHTIYEELFHAAVWQRSMVSSAQGGEAISPSPDWPERPAPPDARSWTGLVEDFLADSAEAAAVAEQIERWDEVLPEGRTVRERLELLAVHNAYHLGKIVSLRQFLGLWSRSRVERA